MTHRFEHVLVRDAAYDSMERLHDRRSTHLAVAKALAARRPVDAALAAQHFDAAGDVEEALRYYLSAASAAQGGAAHSEAISLLDRALELTFCLPEGPERDATEVNIRILRGLSHVSTKGYTAPAAAEDYRRGLDLCEREGIDIALFPATVGIWAYYVVSGDLRSTREATERLASIERADVKPEVLASTGILRFFEGDFKAGRPLLETAVEAFDRRAAARATTWPLPTDPLVTTLTQLGLVRWLQGDIDEAWPTLLQARTRASALPFPVGPFSQCYATSYAGWLTNLETRFLDGLALHEETRRLSEKYGFTFWTVTSMCNSAISRANLGEPEAAAEMLSMSIAQWRALGAGAFVSCYQTELARIRLQLGALEEALRIVDGALERAEQTDERFFSAESHRLRAAILLRRHGPECPEVRGQLEKSRNLSRKQGARV